MNFENLNNDMFQEISLSEMSTVLGGGVGVDFTCCNLNATGTGSRCSVDSCLECDDVDFMSE